MKKIILIVLVLIVFTEISIAQNVTDVRDKAMFGFKMGVNYSNVYNSNGEDFNSLPRVGLATGIFMAVPIGQYFGIQPEVLFSQKGFRATGKLFGSTYKITRTTNYIDVPLYFAFKPSEFLTIVAGPQFSYLLKQKDVFANATTTIVQEQAFINDDIRKNTFGFIGGFDLTLKHFVFGLRAGLDVQDNNGDGTTITPQYKNVWYQTTVGYRFYRNQ